MPTVVHSSRRSGNGPCRRGWTTEGEALPPLSPSLFADGETLRVVVTTNFIGDVVHNVGGDAIELAYNCPTGAVRTATRQNPTTTRRLQRCHVVLVNGLHLKKTMQAVFDSLGDVPVVSINASVETIEFGADHGEPASGDEHETASADHIRGWMLTML